MRQLLVITSRNKRCIVRNLSEFLERKAPLLDSHTYYLNKVKKHGSGEVFYTKQDDIAFITLQNHDKSNAICGKMMYQLASIMDSIGNHFIIGIELQIKLLSHTILSVYSELDQDLKAIVLRGNEKAFCSGADFTLVKEIVNTPEMGFLMCNYMTDLTNRIRQCDLISVSLIEGPAIGGGAELATCTDYRIMAESSWVRFVHASLGAGSTNRF